MLFDKFCGLAERHFPEYEKLLRRTALFNFNYDEEKLASLDPLALEVEDISNCILPFDVSVIENKSRSILIEKLTNNRYKIVDILDTKSLLNNGIDFVISDFIAVFEDIGNYHFVLNNQFYIFSDGGKKALFDVMDLETHTEGKELIANIKHALAVTFSIAHKQLSLLNTKDRFVVEKTGKLKTHGKQIPRAHQRPSYTLLTIKEIREVFKKDASIEASTRELVEGHYRRRHFRELRDERFTKNDDGSNKKLLIEPMWVGPSEATVSGHKYKVRLEL